MLSRQHQRAVSSGEPIEWNGLTLFPILVRDYEAFAAARSSITLSQQTLPVQYVSMRYLEALFAMEHDARLAGGGGGPFARLILLLTLALRLPEWTEETPESEIPFCPLVKREDPRSLAALEVRQGEAKAEITGKNFGQLREIIAAQNAVELPDETENMELVEAERDLAGQAGLDLKVDFESLLYSVAFQCRQDPAAVLDWTIRKFTLMERAIDRSIGHTIAAAAEASGGRYKNGNPYPSWKFDREKHSTALVSLSDFTGRMNGTIESR